MKIPTEVVIAGVRYTIEYVETQREVEVDLKSDDYIGQLDGPNKIIRVHIDPQFRTTVETLIHEIVHAIFTRNAVMMAAIRPKIGEEAFVGSIGRELAELLINNKWIEPSDIPVTKRIV